MKKLILSLGLAAVLAAPLAAPAAAGRLDVDPSVLQPLSLSQAQARERGEAQPGLDYSATRSIQSTGPAASGYSDATAGLRLGNTDKQRGAQGAFFGANGR